MSARARHRISVQDLRTELVDAQDRLEDATERFADEAAAAAEAEDAYKRSYHSMQVRLAGEDAGRVKSDRRTVGERDSLSMQACADEHGVHLIREASLRASREWLQTARARQDAVRSLLSADKALTS